MQVVGTDDRNRLLNALVDATARADVEWRIVAVGVAGAMADDMAIRRVEHRALAIDVAPSKVVTVASALRRLIRRWQPDVVHAHLFVPSLAAVLATRTLWPRPACVVSRHHNRTHHTAGRRMHAYIDAWTARHADAVLAVSDAVKKTLTGIEGVPPERVSVVYNGLDERALVADGDAVADWRRRSGSPLLAVAVGRLDREKDYPALLRAVGFARRTFPGLQLVVAGSGPSAYVEELQTIANQVGAGEVQFVGWIGDVFALMSAADVFVQASRDEACPQSILEAQALATPIAVTTPGGARDVVAPEYPDIAPGDPVALGQRIVAVLQEPERERAAARLRAKVVRDRFSADSMARGHLELYRAVTKVRRG